MKAMAVQMESSGRMQEIVKSTMALLEQSLTHSK